MLYASFVISLPSIAVIFALLMLSTIFLYVWLALSGLAAMFLVSENRLLGRNAKLHFIKLSIVNYVN